MQCASGAIDHLADFRHGRAAHLALERDRCRQTGTSTFDTAQTSNRLSAVSGLISRSYSYDAAGNTLSNGTASFDYDDSGRLVSATAGAVTTSYAHNGLGERVAKDDGNATTWFVYDEAGHLIGEYDDAGELIQETVWLGDTPIATLRPDGQSGVDVYYVHVDHLNTPRKVTRPGDDEIVWRWDSDPFGTTPADEDPDGDQATFTYNLSAYFTRCRATISPHAGPPFHAMSGRHFTHAGPPIHGRVG